MEARLISPTYKTWFAEHCALRATFEALTGPVNRSVLVYEYRGEPTRNSACPMPTGRQARAPLPDGEAEVGHP